MTGMLVRFFVSLALWLALCIWAASSMAAQPALSACVQAASPKYASRSAGVHLVFVCTDKVGASVYPAGLSCLHTACNHSAFAASVARVITATDYRAAIDAEVAANIPWTCDAPPHADAVRLCAERRDFVASNWAAWTAGFKAPAWRVKPNGTATTRPAYTLSAGVLGAREAGRATVGALCNTGKPYLIAGADIRAEYGPAGLVTICARVAG